MQHFEGGEDATYICILTIGVLMGFDDSLHTLSFTVRGGSKTYVKVDGRVGTAGKGSLVSDELAFRVAAVQDQTIADGRSGGYIVRRPTPLECERLQGMPDGYTDLTGCDVDKITNAVADSLQYDIDNRCRLRKKTKRWSRSCPDSPRYKAIGNSFAVPVVRWIGERIQAIDEMVRSMDGD